MQTHKPKLNKHVKAYKNINQTYQKNYIKKTRQTEELKA